MHENKTHVSGCHYWYRRSRIKPVLFALGFMKKHDFLMQTLKWRRVKTHPYLYPYTLANANQSQIQSLCRKHAINCWPCLIFPPPALDGCKPPSQSFSGTGQPGSQTIWGGLQSSTLTYPHTCLYAGTHVRVWVKSGRWVYLSASDGGEWIIRERGEAKERKRETIRHRLLTPVSTH